ARGLPERREPVGIDTALEYALITAPDARNPALVRRLDAVACRLFGEKD
ncbi:MAG: S-methyl-5'-thioadenosine phosphorylase, partial [Pseudomonadota bacterium]|nr:S-methyl-5'-thioadenosine phosphorylase [Pseudomonadota bacterium]